MVDERTERTRGLLLAQQEYLGVLEGRRVVPVPPASRVVLLGPHPDDIVLGCGGTVAAYVEAGVAATFVCLTDGRACVADPAERETMARVRRDEECAAARLLGVEDEDVELMAIPEDRFVDENRLDERISRLGAILVARRADAVFVPYWLELHPLHRYANHLLAETLRRIDLEATIYAYEVASFVPPSFVVDVSRWFEKKEAAVSAYRSQLRVRDYLADVALLGALHAPLAGPAARAAEVFFGLAARDYCSRILVLGLDRPETLSCGIQPVMEEGRTEG